MPDKNTDFLITASTVVSILPFWFRFAQCLHKLHADPKKNYL